jgi:hypothetical protein
MFPFSEGLKENSSTGNWFLGTRRQPGRLMRDYIQDRIGGRPTLIGIVELQIPAPLPTVDV